MARDLVAALAAVKANLRRLCDVGIAEREAEIADETNPHARVSAGADGGASGDAGEERARCISPSRQVSVGKRRVSEASRARQDSNLRPTA
jgi:hypothetical protein